MQAGWIFKNTFLSDSLKCSFDVSSVALENAGTESERKLTLKGKFKGEHWGWRGLSVSEPPWSGASTPVTYRSRPCTASDAQRTQTTLDPAVNWSKPMFCRPVGRLDGEVWYGDIGERVQQWKVGDKKKDGGGGDEKHGRVVSGKIAI